MTKTGGLWNWRGVLSLETTDVPVHSFESSITYGGAMFQLIVVII